MENKDNNNIFETLPSVRVAQYRYSLSSNVSAVNNDEYGDYSNLFDKAEVAYRDGLGAGAIIYLRIVFEKILCAVASELKIKTTREDGRLMGIKNILLEIEKNIKIMPEVYANNGYKLFKELSDVIHGNNDEELALKKYEACKSLVVGVLDKVKNDKQYLSACKSLGM